MKNSVFRAASVALFVLAGASVANAATTLKALQEESADPEETTGFVYDMPAETAELPGLMEQLTAESERARIGYEEMAAETREAMPDNPAVEYLTHQEHWRTAGRAGRLLSLVNETYVYAGGAHGLTGYAGLLWDTEEDHGVDLTSVFTDRYRAYSIVDREYCRQLRAQQEERGIDVADAWWSECPLLHERTVFPAGEEGSPFTSVGVIVEAYVAGSYADGIFEIEVPVTQELLDLVKPEYRAAFALPSE